MARTSDQEHERLAALASQHGLPSPPRRPEPGTCCTRGCDPCIWDYYDRAVARWCERHLSGGAAAPAARP